MHAPGALEEVQNDLLRPIRFLKPESYRNFYIDMHIYIYIYSETSFSLMEGKKRNIYIYIFSFLLLHSLLRTPHYMLELPIP